MASARRLPLVANYKTYGNATRDYTSLAAWEADTDINLVLAAKGEVLDCFEDNSPYDDSITMDGSITNLNYFRVVKAVNGQRGTKTTGVRFEPASSAVSLTVFNVQENYAGVYDIAAKITVTSAANGICFAAFFAAFIKFVGITAYDSTSGTGLARGIYMASNHGSVVDCFCDNNRYAGIQATSNSSFGAITLYIYSNTVTNNGRGFYLVEGSDSFPLNFNSKDCIMTNNIINIATFGTPIHNQTSNVQSGVTFASDGYHLAPSDTGAKDLGTDLSADASYAFNDDIDGETITAPWSKGCDWPFTGSLFLPIINII